MGFGFRSAGRIRTARYFSFPKLAVFGLVLAGVGWYVASRDHSVRSPGAKQESIAPTFDTAPTLRATAEKHHLLMGAAVDSESLSDAPFAATLAREYSAMEPANEMKFDSIHPKRESYDFAGPDALVAFAQKNSMRLRGHNLVWYTSLPDWISVQHWIHAQDGPSAPYKPEALNKILAEHIATVVGRYRGKPTMPGTL